MKARDSFSSRFPLLRWNTTPGRAQMANLTSLLYHKYKSLQSPARAPTMSTKDISLPLSSRSGHPIYTSKTLPSTTPASLDQANSQPSIEISLNGTWRSLAPHFNLPNVELLDLTSRFSYTAKKNHKATGSRPRNALKRGLRPTKSFELPPVIKSQNAMAATRQIYRQHSHSLDADEEDVQSEPSPSKSRLMAPKPPHAIKDNLVVKQPHPVMESTSSAHKRRVEEISSDDDDDDRTLYETTPPRPRKVPRLTATASDPATPSGRHNNEPLIQPPGQTPPIQSTGLKGPALHTFPLPAAPPTTTTTHKAAPAAIPNNSTPLQSLPPTSTILRIYLPPSPTYPHHQKTYIPSACTPAPTSTPSSTTSAPSATSLCNPSLSCGCISTTPTTGKWGRKKMAKVSWA